MSLPEWLTEGRLYAEEKRLDGHAALLDLIAKLGEDLDLIRRCAINSRQAPNVLDTILWTADRAIAAYREGPNRE